jgi:hypothetical protein
MDFKKVFGEDTVRLIISPGWTYEQFIDNTYTILSREFDIPKEQLELVEAGQSDSEKAPALEPFDETMASKWGSKLKYLAFYVRQKVVEQRESEM